MRRLFFFGSAVLAGVLLFGCGTSSSQCGADNCAGCCDSNGVCQLGNQDAVCGAGGGACTSCASGSSCAAGLCSAEQVDAGTQLCGATAMDCSDSTVQQLDLKSAPATGLILNAANGTGWMSTVDVSAGGYPPTQGYVYARFTEGGLEKLPLDDLSALDSMEWDIAFRRFIIRINSGDSGPSCSVAAALPAGLTYDDLSVVPTGIAYDQDSFLDPAPGCTFVSDGNGLTTSPKTALAAFYQYSGCVEMTGRVFLVQTRAGRTLKLTVKTYYANEADQTTCNTTHSVPMGTAAGTMRVRWQFLN